MQATPLPYEPGRGAPRWEPVQPEYLGLSLDDRRRGTRASGRAEPIVGPLSPVDADVVPARALAGQ